MENLILSLFLVLCASATIIVNCQNDAVSPALFVFGDSLYDAGNNAYLNPTEFIPANHYPYGRSYFPISTGRLSDGLIMPDFITIYAGVHIPLPYLSSDVNLSEGANFASAGAGVMPENTKAMNFGDQVTALKTVTVNWTSSLGAVKAQEALRKAVYLVALGGNDYFGFSTNSPNATEAEQEERVQTVITAYMDEIKEIYALGGRKFAIQNVAQLGCLPVMNMVNDMVCGECAELPFKLASMHNTALTKALADLSVDPNYSELKYGIFDYNTKLNDMINNPTNYGFYVGASACCGYGLFFGGNCGIEPYIMCTNPGAYVFFDGGHTTQRANYILTKMFWDGGKDVVKPYNVKQLFQLDFPKPIGSVTEVSYNLRDEL